MFIVLLPNRYAGWAFTNGIALGDNGGANGFHGGAQGGIAAGMAADSLAILGEREDGFACHSAAGGSVPPASLDTAVFEDCGARVGVVFHYGERVTRDGMERKGFFCAVARFSEQLPCQAVCQHSLCQALHSNRRARPACAQACVCKLFTTKTLRGRGPRKWLTLNALRVRHPQQNACQAGVYPTQQGACQAAYSPLRSTNSPNSRSNENIAYENTQTIIV